MDSRGPKADTQVVGLYKEDILWRHGRGIMHA